MAFQLFDTDTEEFDGVTFAESVMDCYDVILGDETDWSEEWSQVLPARSALEFVRDSLPPDRAKILDEADSIWRKNAKAFNHFCRYYHARKDLKTELEGWVVDGNGHTPEIPKEHWWWWPLEV